LRSLDSTLWKALPAFVYECTVGPGKRWCSGLTGIKESLENEEKEAELRMKNVEEEQKLQQF
jgi:hypothetical protein